MTKKWIIENGGIKDTVSGMTFDSFMEIIIVLNGQSRKLRCLASENEQLKASLYAEKTNTAEVVNDYSKQFKRHSAQFSFMMDLAEDLGVDVTTLEASDD